MIVLRVALVILHADPARGGAERYTADLAQGLRGRGHEVSVLASSFGPQGPGPGEILLPARGITRAGRYTGFLDALDAHLEQARYDIVHAMLPVRTCDVYHPHAGIAAEAVSAGHLKHDGAIHRSLARAGNRLNLRRQKFATVERALLNSKEPPVVLCLSEYVKSFVRKHYTLSEEKLATLFNAVDLGRFDPSKRPEIREQMRANFHLQSDDVVGLMIAQDFARKGLKQAILAMARVPDPRLKLLVAGKPDADSYRQLATELKVSERVIFAGPTSDPFAFYRCADFFVLPTRHDPCSLVVLEALAMGLPVISTALNGACEIMSQGVHGTVLSDPMDIDRLADAMRQLTDANVRKAIERACLDLRPALAYDRHLDRLLDIYSSLRSEAARLHHLQARRQA